MTNSPLQTPYKSIYILLACPQNHSSNSYSSFWLPMGDEWIHMYNQNNQQLPFHLSDHDQVNNPGFVSDSTVVTATTTQPSSGLSPDGGRVVKPVRKRSRASRRTPTTLLNTDAANFRAMVQQFTGGPSNNAPNFAAFGFPGNSSNTVLDPTVAAYHLAPPPQQPPLYQFQNQHPPPPQQQPPFMFSLGNSAPSEAFFQQGGGFRSDNNNNNVNYMGLFHESSPAAQNPRPA